MTLVLTLMILVIITALVVEFSYSVYTTTASLYNWKDSQRLSFVALSGVSLSAKTISEKAGLYSYTYPAKIEFPVEGVSDQFRGSLIIRVEDENSKFNLNSLVMSNGKTTNPNAYKFFKRLLKNLNLDDIIADRIADWIDKDNEPRQKDSEDGAKNTFMDSVDELLVIKGIDVKIYEKLLPYITVYGRDSIYSDLININTASVPVIMSLDENITKELAERVLAYRGINPFEKPADIQRVAGFEGLGQSLMGRIAVKATNFRITSIAEENKIKRIIECIMEIKGETQRAVYWREM